MHIWPQDTVAAKRMTSKFSELIARAFWRTRREFIVRAAKAHSVSTKEISNYRTLVAFLFASPGSLIMGLIASVSAPFLCWLATGDEIFGRVFVFAAGVSVMRAATLVNYRRQDHTHDNWARTRMWDQEFMAGATLLSGALGLNAYLALSLHASPPAHLCAVSFNIALASGYVARNAARPTFVVVQLMLFTLPLAAALLASSDPWNRFFGCFALLYVFNNIAIVFSVHRNLIELIRAKRSADWLTKQLHCKNVTLDQALNTMPHGAAMFDDHMRLLVANARHYALFALPPEMRHPTFEETQRQLVLSGVVSRSATEKLEQACRASLKKRAAMKVETVTQGGAHLIVHFNPSSDDGFLMFTEDATARKTAEAEVRRLARYDTLTGLPNRHEFGRRLARAFDELAGGGSAFALLYLDLDGFKRINDTLGHEIGDGLLIEVSKRLKRKNFPATVICRLGGDEFAAICLVDHSRASQLVLRIRAALQEPFVVKNCVTRVSASIGVAFAPEHGASAEELLRHADIALYRAKAKGRGVAMIYDDAMAKDLTERLSLEADLMAALGADALELHFQPIVELSSGGVVAYEALARWPHPTRGYVPPDIFIPIAEQTGAIDRLGCFAIREACAVASTWDPSISVGVNVSVLQFRNPDLLVECVQDSLAAHRFEPRRLILEITESLFIDEFEETVKTINRLKEIGVRFALDDFGAGYSSLSLLSRLPFSIVKIDQSLTGDIAGNTTSYAIVEAVCALAKRIGLTVVVEGVETHEQQLAVRSTGADRGQGWLFGKAEPAAKIAAAERISAA